MVRGIKSIHTFDVGVVADTHFTEVRASALRADLASAKSEMTD